jgi:hypothetical protein
MLVSSKASSVELEVEEDDGPCFFGGGLMASLSLCFFDRVGKVELEEEEEELLEELDVDM